MAQRSSVCRPEVGEALVSVFHQPSSYAILLEMTLLQQMDIQRAARREALRLAVREQLRSALDRLVPVAKVIVFGSLTVPGDFSEFSDVDLALETEPASPSVYQLTALLAEELGRPADIVLLSECRFRERIEREGEVWMQQD